MPDAHAVRALGLVRISLSLSLSVSLFVPGHSGVSCLTCASASISVVGLRLDSLSLFRSLHSGGRGCNYCYRAVHVALADRGL